MITVRLLGIPAVFDAEGCELRVRSQKQLGVLLYLVMDGREHPVSRDVLMEAFWEEVSRDRAYHSLCQAVTAIRGVLGREAVVSRSHGLLLAAPVQTDIDALGTDHERGDLLNPLRDVEWLGGTDLAHWVERSRERCRRMAKQVLRDGMVAHRRAGATLRVHRCAVLLYELDALSEPAALALAERELLQGDVVGAIRFLRQHVTRVSATLGCQPQAAPERLLRRLEAGSHPPVELVPKRLAAHAARVRPTVLVARERELSHLEGEWQKVHQEHALRSCVITGHGGIGKSSLVRRFAATVAGRAQTAFLVSCQEMGEGIPFAAVADLVAALLRDPSVSATDPLWLAEVSRIQPAVRSQYPGVPDPMESPPEAVRVRIAEGVTRMIGAITDGAPLALLFDDLQYMDPATRDVLAVLYRRAQHLPLLLVGTARSLGMESGLPSGPLGRESMPWTSSLRLGPLSADGTRTLISTLVPTLPLDTPVVERRIVELSEGNPQFTEMLLADWQQYASASLAAGRAADELPSDWQPPESLRHAFAKLYAGLDDTTQQLLHMLAVAQRALTPEEVAEAIGQNANVLDQAALEVLTLGILRLDQGALTFKNELHRAFAYFAMNLETQKYYHAMFARAATRASSSSDFRRGLESGHHYLRAGDVVAAGKHIRHFAPLAIEAGASSEAEEGLSELLRAEAPSATTPTLLLLAAAQVSSNKPKDCLATLSSLQGTRLSSRETLESDFLSLRAALMLRSMPAETLAGHLHQVLSRSVDTSHFEVALPALQLCAELAAESGRTEQLQSLRRTCEGMLGAHAKPEQLARTMLSLGFMSLAIGSFDEAQVLFQGGMAKLDSGIDSGPLYWRLLNGIGVTETALGRYLEAERVFDDLERSVTAAPMTPSPLLWSNIAVFWQERGHLRHAAEYFRRALDALVDHPNPKACATVLSSAASLAIDLGEFALAENCLERAQAIVASSRIVTDRIDTALVRADLLLATQEDELAWKLLRESVLPLVRRGSAIGEAARQERLLRQYTFAAEGVRGYREHCAAHTEVLGRLPFHGRLEIDCLHDWVMWVQDPGAAHIPDRSEIEGFAGVALHLAAIGALAMPSGSPHGTSSSQLVLGLYPQLYPEGVPETLDWALPDP